MKGIFLESYTSQRSPKDLTNPLAPATQFLAFAASIGFIMILFHPSWFEFLVVMFVDSIMFAVMFRVDRYLFLRRHPEFRGIYPTVDLEQLQPLDQEKKQQVLNALVHLPLLKSNLFFLITIPKVLPGGLLIVFWWNHPNTSYVMQFVLFLAMEILLNLYLYSAVFFDYHRLASKVIEDLHHRLDFSEAFRNAKYTSGHREFLLQEALALGALLLFTIILQVVVVASQTWTRHTPVVVQVTVVGLFGLILLTRIWYLSRSYFMGGLEFLFHAFEALDYNEKQQTLALHSSAILARFEQTMNFLTERLRKHEQHLAHWLLHETGQSRLRALGEISGLVVHDLSSPLHTIQFCLDEIQENPALASSGDHLKTLRNATDRATELVTSLRAYLRNPSERESGTKQGGRVTVGEAYAYVLRLLRTQFLKSNFANVRIELDPRLKEIRPKLSQVDLVHVLHNILKNCVENLLDHQISEPAIKIQLEATYSGSMTINLIDNGTGLSPTRFDKITSFQFSPRGQDDFQEGLGLRLTRRLIERNGGTLAVAETNSARGTLFRLVLPLP